MQPGRPGGQHYRLIAAVKTIAMKQKRIIFVSLVFMFLNATCFAFDEEIQYLERALAVNPDNLGTYYGLGAAYYKMEDYEKAIETHKKFTQLLQKFISEQADQNLNIGYQGVGSYDEETETVLSRALQINPRLIVAYGYLLGLTTTSQMRVDEEIRYLEKAIQINPQNFGTLLALGAAYYRRKNYDKALECLSGFTQANPDCSITHYGLAIAYYEQGDPDNASMQANILRQSGYNDLINELAQMGITASTDTQTEAKIQQQITELSELLENGLRK